VKRQIPPRLRGPLILVVGTTAVLVIGGATHGWSSIADVVPIPIAVIAGLFIVAGRDNDMGAVVRHEVDERQEHQRLKVQALVGRVLSLAVAVAYIVASAAKAEMWPWIALLGVTVLAFVIGWLLYGEHDLLRRQDRTGTA
jgi:O-antigen/teichoic acid export membrane protein